MPKIHSIRENHLEEESESSFGWSHSVNAITKVQTEESVQEFCRPPLVKQYYNARLKSWLPISLHSSDLQNSPPEVGRC